MLITSKDIYFNSSMHVILIRSCGIFSFTRERVEDKAHQIRILPSIY